MLIDPFTVAAQVVNFLVLVWLLKRFLYRPILTAIDAREKRIARELADADDKQAQALRERETYREKIEDLDRERGALMRKARADAKSERQRLLEEAREAAASLETRRRESLELETRDLGEAVSLRAQHEILKIARKTLSDLADARLEERMCEVFIGRLKDTSASARTTIAAALAGGPGDVVVRSAFDLPAAQQAAIESAITDTFSVETAVRFEQRPDLVSGIELTTGGHKIAWSIRDYLQSLQRGIDEMLREAGGGQDAHRDGT